MRTALMMLVPVLFVACGGNDNATESETDPDYCSGEETCPVAVANISAECGKNETPSLTATSEGYDIDVEHLDAATGCCPTLDVEVTLNTIQQALEVEYVVSDDACDCVCQLDYRYQLVDVPKGDWTLQVSGVDDVQVMVWGE